MTTDVRNILFTIGISFWQTLFVVLLFLFFFIAIIIFWKKSKSISKVLLLSISFALILGIIFLFFNYYFGDVYYEIFPPDLVTIDPLRWTWQDEISVIFNTIVSFYLNLIFIVIPIFIFVMIVNLIINQGKIRRKWFFSKSVFSLLIPIFIGMTIAIVLIPLLKYMSFSGDIVFSGYDSWFEATGVYSLPYFVSSIFNVAGESVIGFVPIIVILIASIIIGFSIKIFIDRNEKYNSSIKNFFKISQEVLINYLKFVSFLLPFVLLAKLSLIFMYPQNIISLGMFILIFLLGLALIMFILNTINYFLVKNKGQYFKTYFSTLGVVFAKGNTINYLPDTIDSSKKMGVSNDVAEFTSTLGLNIGPAICSGYYLMLISLISLNQPGTNGITFITVLLTFIIVLLVNLTTSGIKGGDEMARNVVLSTLTVFGVNPMFYYSTIFSLETILEPIRQLGNYTSFINSNIIHERLIKNPIK